MSRIHFPHQPGTAAQSPAGPAEPNSAGPAALRPPSRKRRALAGMLLCTLLIISLLLAACSPSLSEEEAERAAREYVEGRGIFYTRTAEGMNDVPDYALSVVRSEKAYGSWLFEIEAAAAVNGTVRRAEVRVAVDAKTGKAFVLG